jgi:hypothetical protein
LELAALVGLTHQADQTAQTLFFPPLHPLVVALERQIKPMGFLVDLAVALVTALLAAPLQQIHQAKAMPAVVAARIAAGMAVVVEVVQVELVQLAKQRAQAMVVQVLHLLSPAGQSLTLAVVAVASIIQQPQRV